MLWTSGNKVVAKTRCMLGVVSSFFAAAAAFLMLFSVLNQPGRLRKVQGIGWYLEEANIAQVSTNILDYEVTPLHVVHEEIRKGAEVWRRWMNTAAQK